MENIRKNELHRVAITGIIYTPERKYLITKRSPHKKAFPGKWTVPGGGLETGDYFDKPKTANDQWYYAVESALRREILEEVNVEIGKPKYLLDLVFIKGDNLPVLVLSYYCPFVSGEIKLDEDSVEYVWVTYEEAEKYDLIDGIIDEIKMVDDILKKQG